MPYSGDISQPSRPTRKKSGPRPNMRKPRPVRKPRLSRSIKNDAPEIESIPTLAQLSREGDCFQRNGPGVPLMETRIGAVREER